MSRGRSLPHAVRMLRDGFDPRGRMSRHAYVRLLLRAMLAASALFCLTVWIAGTGLRVIAFAILACAILLWLATLAWTVRRLHDRDRTGWWLALTVALYAGSFAPVDRAADTHPIPVALYVLVTVVFFVWFVVETIGLHGTPGPNRYGPEPDEAPLPLPRPPSEPIERLPP